MFFKILVIAILAILFLPTLFELIISMIFSQEMGTTIIEAMEDGAMRIFSCENNDRKIRGNILTQKLTDVICWIGREAVKIVLYSLFIVLVAYIVAFFTIIPIGGILYSFTTLILKV